MSKILTVPWQGRAVLIDRALLGEMWENADDDAAAAEVLRRLQEAEQRRDRLAALGFGERLVLIKARELSAGGRPPTVREIGAAAHMSPAVVHKYVHRLVVYGFLAVEPGQRGIMVK